MKELLRTILITVAVILFVIGSAFFWGAMTLEQYLAAAAILGLAALIYLPAHFMNPDESSRDIASFAAYWGGGKSNSKQPKRKDAV
jgi:hypothetical protein